MSDNELFVSILIPCRNEEKFIGKCLDSIIANDYPKDYYEVLAIDGISNDRTREIVNNFSRRFSYIKCIDNIKKTTPVALNKGIKNAKGEYILILGSHSTIQSDFISKNVYSINKYPADCVGGILVTVAGDDTYIANSIEMAVSHYFGVGNTYFRIGAKEPKCVDTVPFGCYRKEIFDKIGLFDEDFIRNQDDEFNYRLTKNGGKIYLVPEILSYYYARPSLSKLWAQYFQYGYWKVRVIQKHRLPASWRHIVPIALVLGLMVSAVSALFSSIGLYFFIFIAGSYSALTAFFSAQISFRKGWKYFFVIPLAFGTIHFSYGLGFLKGIFDFAILKKHLKKKIEDEALTR